MFDYLNLMKFILIIHFNNNICYFLLLFIGVFDTSILLVALNLVLTNFCIF